MGTALYEQGSRISLSDVSRLDPVVAGFLLVKLANVRNASIDEHKHYLSERGGYDVGRDFAQADWEIRGFDTLVTRRFLCDQGLALVGVER